MKRFILLFVLSLSVITTYCQTYNAAYVKALYKKYPSVKSDFCKSCKLWVNPYYKSIADTAAHIPLVTVETYTKENYAKTKTLNISRSGVFAGWNVVTGQPNEDNVYTAANQAVKPLKDEIAKGHCQAWVLNAFSYDSAILSDTYTFNAAPEDQGQNVGTEIATENMTRNMLTTVDVTVWCGTFVGNRLKSFGDKTKSFSDGKITDVYPAYYWKVIKAGNSVVCYWMPNLKTESQARIPQATVTYAQLVKNLGFSPIDVLK